jgi:hypothetical protein
LAKALDPKNLMEMHQEVLPYERTFLSRGIAIRGAVLRGDLESNFRDVDFHETEGQVPLRLPMVEHLVKY